MSLTQNTNNQPEQNWKTRIYLTGATAGTFFGLLASYLFARAAEEEAERNGGKPMKIPTTQLLGLALAALGLIRQIAEMGKGDKKK
jgi:hypothetical protein